MQDSRVAYKGLPRSKEECIEYLEPTVYDKLIYNCRCIDLILVFIAEVDQEEINEIIDDAIPKKTKRQTNCNIAVFRGKCKI